MTEVPVNAAETVRCEIRDAVGRILLLEKHSASKNPGMFEFPGGKIDAARGGRSTAAEQRATIIREVQEETGLEISDVPVEKVESFSYNFEAGGVSYVRDVHLFRAQVPAGDRPVEINRTTTADGESEDKHAGFRWVTREEFSGLRRDGKIAANSIAPAIR
jgi:8-oxo-dGTP pyrophosphatase MutT (NUDIX family)